MHSYLSVVLKGSIALLLALYTLTSPAQVKGIYITQSTLEDTAKINHLIKRAKAVGLNTFVIDYEGPNKKYTQNIELVKEAGIRYVARIVVFPDGATHEQMHSTAYREKKLNTIKQAIALGAQEIQLDYIRYNSKNRPSEKNVEDVRRLIQWYRDRIAAYKIPTQIDVFGITSFHHEKRIGQYPKVLVNSGIDSINPMVYPSHYEPYKLYSAQPYKTVYTSLTSLKEQLKDQRPVKIVAYIEASNYRYPLTRAKKAVYVKEQIKAAEDANIAGWYFWSANNIYEHVFKVLENHKPKSIAKAQKPLTNNDQDSLVEEST